MDFWILLVGIIMFLLSIITIVGNIAVLLSYYLDKNIRQPANYFIFSLAVSDLIIGLEGIPVYTAFLLNGNEWAWGWFLCDLWLSIDYTVCLASIYTVLGITVDRYCSVKHPATYRNWRTPKKIMLIIAVIWIVPSLLFSVSIFGYGTFTGTGRIIAEHECYVQFMNNGLLNMSMYISYYWSTLCVMLYLYYGIYRAAKQLALKSDQKTKRLALLTEMRKPEMSIRTSEAAQSSSDSPNDTTESSRHGLCKNNNTVSTSAPAPSLASTAGNTPNVKNPILGNHVENCTINSYSTFTSTEPMIVTSVNRSMPLAERAEIKPPPLRILNRPLPKTPVQELSSVIERESTAPCVSPEPSQCSGDEIPPSAESKGSLSTNQQQQHVHFGPSISLPFIDADSVSSLVGNDELWKERRRFQEDNPGFDAEEGDREAIERPNNLFHDFEEDKYERPNCERERRQMAIELVQKMINDEMKPNGEIKVEMVAEEVTVPLIAVSRVESIRRTFRNAEGRVRRLLTVMRSRSTHRKRKRRSKDKENKSRSENRARKALRTITFILGSFIVLWTPFYVMATIVGFCKHCEENPIFKLTYNLSYYLCYMNSPINPICYAMAQKQFKKTLTRIFKGDFRRV